MNSEEKFVRVYEAFLADDLKKHTLVIEETTGQCQNCKTVGISYLQNRNCPSCGTQFRYLATTVRNREIIGKILWRIKKENLSLKLLEKEDFDKAIAKDALQDLFRKT